MKKKLIGFITIGLLSFVGCKNDDGNIETTKIGEQEWMTKNLNLDHFQNGDKIQEAKTKEEWVKASKNKEPAWCYYDNNSSNSEKYGKLYNFYAVTDPRGLAPNGWHVPSDAEWTVLEDFLSANGNEGKEGDALKATSGWDSGGNGTDDYGWLGLPGGNSYSSGEFANIGATGCWWSSSQSDTSNAWDRNLHSYNDNVNRNYFANNKKHGESVRCLRDQFLR